MRMFQVGDIVKDYTNVNCLHSVFPLYGYIVDIDYDTDPNNPLYKIVWFFAENYELDTFLYDDELEKIE